MKKASIPVIVFLAFVTGYVIFLVCTVSLLPQRMATHFDINGQPNGWMNRSSAVMFQGAIGLLSPIMTSAIFYVIRFVPTRWISLPQKNFWFSPARHDETCAYLFRQSLWLASMLVGLQCVVWFRLIASNNKNAPQLSPSGFLVMAGVLAIFLIVWIVNIFGHFAKSAQTVTEGRK